MPEAMMKIKSWLSLLPPITVSGFVEIAIISVFVYECLLWIKNTRAWQLLKGLLVIFAFITAAAIFHLTTIIWLIKRISTAAIIGAIVIFQPELRKALEQLGSRKFISNIFPDSIIKVQGKDTLNEIVKATFEMSKKKTGALMVIQRSQSLHDIEETGIAVDGIVTSALLINIFEINTPLHDGAIVIVGDRVSYATCYLPLSDTEISKDFGTRHRAALGVSENTDSITVVVSEETGRVSVAIDGKLIKVQNAEELKSYLPSGDREEENRSMFSFFRLGKGEIDEEVN